MKPQLESASISGTAQVGETLTAAVEPAGATASYQWMSATDQDGDYAEITSATNSTYDLTASEEGKYRLPAPASTAARWKAQPRGLWLQTRNTRRRRPCWRR